MEPPAAGPRVYVPISHPDFPAPTYAVLQFLGISPLPNPSQSPADLLSHASPPPPSCSSPLHLPSSSPAPNPPFPPPKRSLITASTHSSSDEKDRKLTSIKPCPMKKSSSGSTIAPSSPSPARPRRTGKVLPTVSITYTNRDTIIHTHSSNFREVVHQLTGATSGDKGLMSVTSPSWATTVVRSGAGNGEDSTSAAASPHISLHSDNDSTQEASAKKPVGHPATKLLERRKSNKVLERLSTSCRILPQLVPSPVTPLASDSVKIHLPVTPTSSEGNATPVLNLTGNTGSVPTDVEAMETLTLSGTTPSHENKALLRSYSAKAMFVDDKGCSGDVLDMQGPCTPPVTCTHSLSLRKGTSVSAINSPIEQRSSPTVVLDGPGPRLVLERGLGDESLYEAMDVQIGEEAGADDAMEEEDKGIQDSCPHGKDAPTANDKEFAIAKGCFFLHSEGLRHGDPTLLSLFPESPRES